MHCTPSDRSPQSCVMGLDIGGTKLTAALADLGGDIVDQVRRRTDPEGGAEQTIEDLKRMVYDLLGSSGTSIHRVARMGVGFGGPVDAHRGVVIQSHHASGWEDVPLRSILEEEFNVPVVLDNDANAGTLGEAMFGAGRGERNIVYLNIGTGIGGGIIIDGRLYHGVTTTAGEIGHTIVKPDGPPCTCGQHGCLESIASGWSIARRAREAMEGKPDWETLMMELAGGDLQAITGETVFEAAVRGDQLAQGVIDETVKYLGIGIANVVNILNPGMVIVGGGVSEVGEMLLSPLREAVRGYAMDVPARAVKIVPAELGYDAGIKGAIALALSPDRRV